MIWFRQIAKRPALSAVLLAICFTAGDVPNATAQSGSSAPSSAVVLDRVVAVVDNQAILSSDVEDELRLSILEPGDGTVALTPAAALDHLISRALIEQQMRREDAAAAAPSPAKVAARIDEMRRELPACARENCATDAGWRAFLAAHSFTEERVERHVRNRMEILGFIEQRFRQGIRVTPEEIEAYYKGTLLPQYAPGSKAPALDAVAPRIEEILLQQRVNALFDDWLKNLRSQGEVEVLDPSLASPPGPQPVSSAGEGLL